MNTPISPLVLLAPNAFKGSLTAIEICRILVKELAKSGLRLQPLPMGDGGDGTAAIIAHYLHATPVEVNAVDALGRPQKTFYYRNEATAIIELAEICGIKYLKRCEYDILTANTSGFGMAIEHARLAGVRRLILCIGGSASVDGGLGALQEMGLQIRQETTRYRNPLLNFQDLDDLSLQEKYNNIDCTILCDVNNPICGSKGAAAIFGPQKGANPEQVMWLEQQLQKLTLHLEMKTGKKLLDAKHGGAAGGIALSLHALIGAKLISGAEYCLAISEFHSHLKNCFAVITGEGKIDMQSIDGKISGTIAKICREKAIPIYAVAGLADSNIRPYFDQIFTLITHAISIEDAIAHAPEYLKLIARHIADVIYDTYYSE